MQINSKKNRPNAKKNRPNERFFEPEKPVSEELKSSITINMLPSAL